MFHNTKQPLFLSLDFYIRLFVRVRQSVSCPSLLTRPSVRAMSFFFFRVPLFMQCPSFCRVPLSVPCLSLCPRPSAGLFVHVPLSVLCPSVRPCPSVRAMSVSLSVSLCAMSVSSSVSVCPCHVRLFDRVSLPERRWSQCWDVNAEMSKNALRSMTCFFATKSVLGLNSEQHKYIYIRWSYREC